MLRSAQPVVTHVLLQVALLGLAALEFLFLVFKFLLEHDVVRGSPVFGFDFGDVFETLVAFVELHGVVDAHVEGQHCAPNLHCDGLLHAQWQGFVHAHQRAELARVVLYELTIRTQCHNRMASRYADV